MGETVRVDRDGDIAVVVLDNPPVNALSYALRAPLAKALEELRDDATVRGVVITCAGRTFVAGADITEFGKPMQLPQLYDLIDILETFRKPTVAAIHGTALGGGLELALSCHFRVADRDARFGLPEVKLGLLPGAGGTQRLPRLVGPMKAVRMVVSGTPIGAAEALAEGLADAVFEADLVPNAVAFARSRIGSALTNVRDRDERLAEARKDIAAFDAEVATLLKKSRGLDAPAACARSVRNALTMPFPEAAAAERSAFIDLVTGDQSRAQRHLFFAEREAAKVPGVGRDVEARPIRRVGVVGAGTMGGGIAMSFANGGLPVTLLEVDSDALARGLATIGKNYDISVARGSLSEADKNKRMALFRGTTSYADLDDCDLIVEAVFEEMALKKDVFRKLDTIAKPGAILATNTSYLDVDEIAATTGRPSDVLGLHFFSPANVMKLVEIVRGRRTAPEILATAIAVARRIAKVPVVVGVCHGFVGNRMLAARSEESEALLLEGATPVQVDRVFTDFGWPMGPFQMFDLAGLDIGWRNRRSLGRHAVIADPLCEQGRYGQKTGRGFYLYSDGARTAQPDPEVTELIIEKARELGISRRTVSDQEILERTLYPMINEGAKILEEGIALRASDIDTIWVNGYGFPVGRGGPMFYADMEGLPKIVARLDHWHHITGDAVYQTSSLLRELAESGGAFTTQ